ncbi:MAG: hypothetical protein FWG64_09055 [Firmicutes bacterium]|nr:hypothetical protein [Bacillota bacterium]
MNQKRMFTKVLLYNLVQFALIYGVAILVASLIFDEVSAILYTLLTFVPFIFYFYVRTFVKNRILMFVLHFAPIFLTFLLFSNLMEQVFMVGILAIMTLISIANRIKNTKIRLDSGFGVFVSVLLTILCFLGVWQGYQFLATVYPILIMIAVLSTILFSRIDRTDSSLEAITQTSTQPIDRILTFDNKTNPILLIILVVVSLLFWLLLINPLLVQISYIQFTANPIELPEPDLPEPPPAAENTGMNLGLLLGDELAQPHPFWELLSALVFFLMQAAALLFAIFLVIRGIIMLYRFTAYNRQNIADTTKIEEKTFIFSQNASNIRLPFLDFFNLPADKTRAAFRKKIIHHRKKGVPLTKFDTPKQIAQKISHAEDISQLAADYEKIRYYGENP